MRQFRIETRLDRSGLSCGSYRLHTNIDRAGQDSIGLSMELPAFDNGSFDYALERHFHELKKFILGQHANQVFKESSEYQQMKRDLAEAHTKLDDIADIADPEGRG